MICPKCGKEMTVDDTDCDYKEYNGRKVLIEKSCWLVCEKCNLSGYYNTKLSYSEPNGEELKLDEPDFDVREEY